MSSRWKRAKLRWLLAEWADLWPLYVVLVGYGVVRAGVVVWVLARGGPPPVLGCSGAVSGFAAAGEAVAVVLLMIVVRWRRPVAAWLVAAVAVVPALVDAGLWVALGSTAGAGVTRGRSSWPRSSA